MRFPARAPRARLSVPHQRRRRVDERRHRLHGEAGARINVGASAGFKRAVATRQFTLGDSELGPWSKRRVFGFFQPLVDDDGRLAGLLFAGFDLSWAQRLNTNVSQRPSEILIVAVVALLTAVLLVSVLLLGRLFLLKPIDELIARPRRSRISNATASGST